jgi:hypothetical protein
MRRTRRLAARARRRRETALEIVGTARRRPVGNTPRARSYGRRRAACYFRLSS